jgi:hypothetical protein
MMKMQHEKLEKPSKEMNEEDLYPLKKRSVFLPLCRISFLPPPQSFLR